MEPIPPQNQRTLPLSLWLTSHDQTMDRALWPVRSMNSAIIFRGAETRFTRADPIGLGLIDRFVACRDVRVLVVCGHAISGTVDHERDRDSRIPGASEENPLFERTRLRMEAHLHGGSQLLERLQAVREMPGISRAARLGRLMVSALYYLADSGLFLRYSDHDESFIPLTENVFVPFDAWTPRR